MINMKIAFTNFSMLNLSTFLRKNCYIVMNKTDLIAGTNLIIIEPIIINEIIVNIFIKFFYL